ncbi:uncharacterized protein BDR25DRAFT_355676 [Lindgomyces ingoldianus]|uniref:Uncharacterized protein n=1 Tax=Lindgomyces ingoldianus TaxID=673940 RepID=A0ACB6QSI4_9PLEO|nr:uncharacterized protein BDR25DRAFT_355676 [Lindgomyces ingoldianus]KAF2469949.1 hypothetical protein BDR25DRAFT_355676 [Lindgomyces ingoldianus]
MEESSDYCRSLVGNAELSTQLSGQTPGIFHPALCCRDDVEVTDSTLAVMLGLILHPVTKAGKGKNGRPKQCRSCNRVFYGQLSDVDEALGAEARDETMKTTQGTDLRIVQSFETGDIHRGSDQLEVAITASVCLDPHRREKLGGKLKLAQEECRREKGTERGTEILEARRILVEMGFVMLRINENGARERMISERASRCDQIGQKPGTFCFEAQTCYAASEPPQI